MNFVCENLRIVAQDGMPLYRSIMVLILLFIIISPSVLLNPQASMLLLLSSPLLLLLLLQNVQNLQQRHFYYFILYFVSISLETENYFRNTVQRNLHSRLQSSSQTPIFILGYNLHTRIQSSSNGIQSTVYPRILS